jgi:hypothetical protein
MSPSLTLYSIAQEDNAEILRFGKIFSETVDSTSTKEAYGGPISVGWLAVHFGEMITNRLGN